MTQHVEVDTGLWRDFHRVVNMSSRELLSWLGTCSAEEDTEQLPDHAGDETGRRVLQILGKRRTDLDFDDAQAMRNVVNTVYAGYGYEGEASAGPGDWRHRLMSLGHDPMRAWRKDWRSG
jgi:hypothetical protein